MHLEKVLFFGGVLQVKKGEMVMIVRCTLKDNKEQPLKISSSLHSEISG